MLRPVKRTMPTSTFGGESETTSYTCTFMLYSLHVFGESFVYVMSILGQWFRCIDDIVHGITELECGPMPNVMAALWNIGGTLCSTPQSLADAHF